MRVRLFKLKRPFLTFLACVIVAIGIKVYFDSADAIKEPKYKVEKELENYLDSFVNLAELKGIDLSYIYEQDITIVWEAVINKNSTNVATSFGRDKDKIIIVVNKKRFMARTNEGRKYVMFHELGHDVLNFKHLNHPDRGMMEPTAYTGFFKNYERFDQERQEKYLYVSLNKMFERYMSKGDGIADDNNTPLFFEDLNELYGMDADVFFNKYGGFVLTWDYLAKENKQGFVRKKTIVDNGAKISFNETIYIRDGKVISWYLTVKTKSKDVAKLWWTWYFDIFKTNIGDGYEEHLEFKNLKTWYFEGANKDILKSTVDGRYYKGEWSVYVTVFHENGH